MFFPFRDENELRCGNPPSCSEKIRSPGVADTDAFHQFKTDTGINTDKKNYEIEEALLCEGNANSEDEIQEDVWSFPWVQILVPCSCHCQIVSSMKNIDVKIRSKEKFLMLLINCQDIKRSIHQQKYLKMFTCFICFLQMVVVLGSRMS